MDEPGVRILDSLMNDLIKLLLNRIIIEMHAMMIFKKIKTAAPDVFKL